MEIELKVSVPTTKKFQIHFPIYRQHDVSGDNYDSYYYTKISEDLMAITIGKHKSWNNNKTEYRLEVEPQYKFDNSSPDYLLGQGMYKCSEEEFNKILKEIKQVLEKII